MKGQVDTRLLLWGLLIVLVVATVSLTSTKQVQADLPSRPTRTPVPTARPETKPRGATIELCVEFPSDWPWHEVHWQEDLRTVVQWRTQADEDSSSGTWYDVKGWQGHLERVFTEGNQVVGCKQWWVAKTDLGKGPFRWQVLLEDADYLLTTSETFDLPRASGDFTSVRVSLSSGAQK